MSSIIAAPSNSSHTIYTYSTTLVYTFGVIEGKILGKFTEHDYFLYAPSFRHYSSLVDLRAAYSTESADKLEQLQRKYHPEIFI
jgi:hypothetical protein